MSAKDGTGRRKIFILAALILFGFLSVKPYIVTGDDGTYIALARSMREGEYRAINVPERPPQTQYPPLFPLLLMPFANLPAGSVGVLRLWVALLSLGAVATAAIVAKRRDSALGLLGVLPFVVSPLFAEYSTSILTETPFLAICYGVIARAYFLFDREDEKKKIDLIIPLGLLAAWLMRSAGVALVIAVIPFLFIKGHRRTAITALVLVVAGMTPWWMWQSMNASDYIHSHVLLRDIYDPTKGFISPLQVLTERVPYNVARYIGRIFPDVLLPPWMRDVAPWTTLFPLKMGLSLLLTGLIGRGFVRRIFERGITVEDAFVLSSIAMLVVHPVFADRYLYIFLPSLCGYMLAAFPSAARSTVAIAWSCILLLGCIASVSAPVNSRDIAYVQAVGWIGEHAGENDVVLARRPATVWFYTGRPSKGYTVPASVETLAAGANWIIRDDYTIGVHAARLYLDPVLASDTARFAPVFVSDILPSVRVYEVRPKGDAFGDENLRREIGWSVPARGGP